MWEIAWLLLAACGVIAVLALLERVRSLTHEIRAIRDEVQVNRELIQNLTSRVYSLEQQGIARVPVDQQSSQEPLTEYARLHSEPVPVPPPLPPAPEIYQPPPVEEPPSPVRTREDWELIIGGNWLAKLGVLVLVVAIALLLGYSVTHLGPAGKVIIGFLVGASMLGAGIALERMPGWKVFSQALIGGGWAAIYFTTYAMHGMEAARILESPAAGTAALLAVAAAMIVYSFRYRSAAITSVAYLAAFVSLNVTTLTTFSVVAALFLAGTLIVIASRMRWMMLATTGVVLTYLTFVFRYDPVIYSVPGILNGQSILWIYWITFECFDLLELQRDPDARGWRGMFYLLNAAGLYVSSLVHGSEMHTQYWAGLHAVAAALFLASAICRARLLPNEDAEMTPTRGRYFGPAALASLAAAAAIVDRFNGIAMSYALFAECEVIIGIGLVIKRRFMSALGTILLAMPFLHVLVVDMESSATFPIAGHAFKVWSLFAILLAAALYLQRKLVPWHWVPGVGGTFLIAAVIHEELPESWASVAWAFMGLTLLTLGVWRHSGELRVQSYLVLLAALTRTFIVNIGNTGDRVVTCVLVTAVFYAGQLISRRMKLGAGEDKIPAVLSIAGTLVLTALLYNEIGGEMLTVALGIEGAALVAAGFALRERPFRLSGLVLFLFCIAKLFVYDLRTLETISRILSFVVLGLMLVAVSWVYTRFREHIRKLL